MAENWLPLTEYSSKYQVSISTLRRRIKANDIQHQLRDGRYLILDQPQEHRPSQAISPSPSKASVDFQPLVKQSPSSQPLETVSLETQGEPILAAANRLLTELKKAYTQILHEKEEQILSLRGEVADLKTLVRVLETENERLSRRK